MKRILKSMMAAMLIVVMTLLEPGGYLGPVNAALSSKYLPFELNGVEWELTLDEDKIACVDLRNIKGENVTLEFPSCKKMEEVIEIPSKYSSLDLPGSLLTSKGQGKFPYLSTVNAEVDLSKVSKIEVHEDWPRFPRWEASYHADRDLTFVNNTSINEIEIDTDNQNDMEFCTGIFSGMKELKKVNINVGSSNTLILNGSVFKDCTKLEQVTLTGQSVKLEGGANFSGCTSLTNITINGSTIVSGKEDFKDCSNLKKMTWNGDVNFTGDSLFRNMNFSDAAFSFAGKVSNGTGIAVISGCKGINTISLNGVNNSLPQNFLTDSVVTNLNIENGDNNKGMTALAAGAVRDTKISGISFNGTTRVGEGALTDCTVTNVYFNTSDVKANGSKGTIGKNTAVTNLYFNHYDINRKGNKVTELDGVPLGSVSDCDKIYVFSPNFSSIKDTPYTSGKKTEVYGYGGTIASYDDKPYLTGKEMFEKWIAGTDSTYENIIQLTGEKPASINLFVTDSADMATLDLSTLKITAKYNEKAALLDQLPVDEKGNVQSGEFSMVYTTDPECNTNYNYKVLKPVEDSYLQGGQYTYTGKSAATDDAEDMTYITCQDDKLKLGVGTYRYYVQAAGETWPLDVTVKQNVVSSINVSVLDQGQKDGKLHVNVGDTLDSVKAHLKVVATFVDGSRAELESSQYEVVKSNLDKNPITAEDTSLKIYYQSLGESLKEITDVQVHEKKVVSFDVTCDKTCMAIGSQLTLEDLTLTNGIYENPLDAPIARINKEYHFWQDGEATDTYTIKSGQNKISVVYDGCVMTDAVSLTGISNDVKDYEISCDVKEVELYKKPTLDISEVMLENVVYTDQRLEGAAKVKSGFHFVVNDEETDTVELVDGENTIRVRYNGLEKKFTVKAYAQSVERIEVEYCGPAVYEGCQVSTGSAVLMVTVYYQHPYEASVLLSNYDVSYGAYHIVPGEDNEIYVYYRGVRSSKPIHVMGLEDGVVAINKLKYNGADKAGTVLNKNDFYLELGYKSGKTVNSKENPEILNKLSFSADRLAEGDNLIGVTYDGALTQMIFVTAKGDGVLTPTATPATTKMPDLTNNADEDGKQDIMETPEAPQNPANSSVPTSTVEPLKQPKKGAVFTIQGVKYKVTAVTKKGGSVAVTGYDKKASKVKLQTGIIINGYSYGVTKIASGAFKNCSKLSGTVSLTKNVKSIGDNAFSGCKNIKKVVFGDNVTQIGKSSFYNCKKLASIQFKTGSVKKIGKKAFKGIAKKYSLKTPKNLKKTYTKRLKGAI